MSDYAAACLAFWTLVAVFAAGAWTGASVTRHLQRWARHRAYLEPCQN